MSYLIAAAGTGGHVFPGLAVGEALVEEGVERDAIAFVGGDRLEKKVYPDHGFRFFPVEIRGLKRSLSPSNLTLPIVVVRARNTIVDLIDSLGVSSVLGLGGYVTIPAALAARRTGRPLFVSEQNAVAGLANRIGSRWATKSFVAFPETVGLENGVWVGNPVRSNIARFNRVELRPKALERYGLAADVPVVGVFGGSLGALSINEAVAEMVGRWHGPPVQVLHLVGAAHEERFAAMPANVTWVRVSFEDRMELFYAASDLVVARAGGAVAELTATATPAVLVPGDFGSTGHQAANAAYLENAGAASVLPQNDLADLGSVVVDHLRDVQRRREMSDAARALARPDAAQSIAWAMIESSR